MLGGRYRLVHEIARGGMAAVWQAEDTLLDRLVAVKLLHPQYADDPEFLERFRREARAAARLSHPNIVPIYDVGPDSVRQTVSRNAANAPADHPFAFLDADARTPYIVMELVEGGSLKDRIRKAAPMPDAEIRSIGSTLAMTLDYAHRKGLIHRDIKPQNVLLGEDNRPRLTDFGIAQAMASSGLTRTGAVMGSVHYLAPELARGKKALPQSDIYSLGVVLYEMATGRVPFEGETDLAVALAHAEQMPAAPRALNARLAPDLERTILRSLAKAPEQRFLSAADLAADLQSGANGAAVGQRGGPATSAVAARRASEATRRMQTLPDTAPAAARPATRRPATTRSEASQRAAPAESIAAPFARRAARPKPGRGASSGVVVLLLALAAVLVALGAGFFGLATLSRDGVASPVPTAAPTAAPKPAVVATNTPPVPTATIQPTATPVPPTPSPAPTASPVPPTATPAPQPTATPRTVAVPQFRGKLLDQAQAAASSAGLTVTVKGVNANIDKNLVADQSPDTGATLQPGGTVMLMVGTGLTVIPDVSNQPRDQAAQNLANNSFRVNLRDRRDPRIPAGVAIGTNPPAGQALARGADVQLDISSGR